MLEFLFLNKCCGPKVFTLEYFVIALLEMFLDSVWATQENTPLHMYTPKIVLLSLFPTLFWPSSQNGILSWTKFTFFKKVYIKERRDKACCLNIYVLVSLFKSWSCNFIRYKPKAAIFIKWQRVRVAGDRLGLGNNIYFSS